jgi:hypothetical protein
VKKISAESIHTGHTVEDFQGQEGRLISHYDSPQIFKCVRRQGKLHRPQTKDQSENSLVSAR